MWVYRQRSIWMSVSKKLEPSRSSRDNRDPAMLGPIPKGEKGGRIRPMPRSALKWSSDVPGPG